VDQVQVDLVDAEPPQAGLQLTLGVPAAGAELGGQEHVLAGHPGGAQRLADAALVAVGLGGVDVPVARLQRPADGAPGLRAVGGLPHAQAQQRHGQPVADRDGGVLFGHGGCDSSPGLSGYPS
jgi:hypothetical protein